MIALAEAGSSGSQSGYKPSRYNIHVPLRQRKLLVFNSVTEQLVLLSEEEAVLLSQSHIDVDNLVEEDKRFAKLMFAGGFLVNGANDEVARIRKRFDRNRNDGSSLNITIATTLGCNLACGYCFQGQNKPTDKLTDATHSRLIDLVEQRGPSLSSLNVIWYGGEPLMNAKEIWRTSVALRHICSQHDVAFKSFIITNGYLLNDEVARRLVDHGVTDAQVTIDGVQSSHDRMRPHKSGRGSFNRIISNIEGVVANTSLRIAVRVSVDADNGADIKLFLAELADRGLGGRDNFSVYFAHIEAISSGCADYEELSLGKKAYAKLEIELNELAIGFGLRKRSAFGQDGSLCQAVRPSDLVLNPNGDIHKCWDTVSQGDLRIANISDEDFIDRIANNSWTQWRGSDHPVCAECKILPICGGGCAFKAVHSDEQSGEAKLPCISLKFNLAEQVFQSALATGSVSLEDWDPVLSATQTGAHSKTGKSHLSAMASS